MLRKGMTIREAARVWVREFNAIPQGMIEKLMQINMDDWREVTAPTAYDSVYIYDLPDGCDSLEHSGELIRHNKEEDTYVICLNDGTEVVVEKDEFEIERDYGLPMWGTMWSFGDSCDTHWLEKEDGIQILSECGFRVYESEEFGYFFGIDGAGYDFYEDHWIPLYKARGLQWHDPDAEEDEKH